MAFTDWVGMQDQAVAAKQRALLANQQQRGQLQMQYGLNADGSVDGNNTLGSIYQNGANTASNYQAAIEQSMRRGFGSLGKGIGGKQSSQAMDAGLTSQAQQIQQATYSAGGINQSDQAAETDYQNQTNSIGRGQADELAQKLAANPINNPTSTPSPTMPAGPGTDPRFAAITPLQVKKNPTIYRTLRNSY